MRDLIKIVESAVVKENMDADNMYDDAPSFMATLANKNNQDFGDKGRGDISSKPNNPRFSDNSMTVDEDNEPISSMGSDEDQSHLEQLHDMLSRTGLTDLEIRQGVKLGMDGKNKIAGQLGISPEEVDLLVNSLIQSLRDEDNQSVDALLDDYYTGVSEGTEEKCSYCKGTGKRPAGKWDDVDDTPKSLRGTKCPKCNGTGKEKSVSEGTEENTDKQIDTIYKHADNPKTPKDRATKGAKIAGGMMKNRDKKAKAKTNTDVDLASLRKQAKESNRPFDKSVMERFSYERDSTGNVTVRDSETGKERYLQGTKAASVLYKLDHGANEHDVLAPLLTEGLIDDNYDGDFEQEISAKAGTYNFPWKYNGENGFATAFYRTDTDTPHLKLQSVRDVDGNEMDVDDSMEQDLLKQAHDFIGEE